MSPLLPDKTIVLLGAGHTNAHILTRWRMEPVAGARLVCISTDRIATYSGMLPGVLAGLLPVEAMEIDLVRLCRAVGAELIIDDVVGLDQMGRRLQFERRPPLRFDVLSVGVGSNPDRSIIDDVDQRTLAIKPMQTFLRRLHCAVERVADHAPVATPFQIAIVGGGVAGVEISLCLQQWLQRRYPSQEHALTLIHAGDGVAAGLTQSAQRIVERELSARGIATLLSHRAKRVSAGRVEFADGVVRDFSLVLLATSAKPPALLGRLGLPTDPRGFLLTDAALRSVSDEPVFAVGDCGSIDGEPLPKAGVYAVRQGPVLWTNIRSLLRGAPLVEFQPQRKFLKLLCTGDGRAIGSYRGLGFVGRFAWAWKNRIDSRFMRMHQDYEPMQMAPPSQVPPMRCVGCGGKVGGKVLRDVLAQLDVPSHDSVLCGLDAPDDVAILRPPSSQLVATVDFFAPPIDDLFLAGRIAMVNALNDVYATGGTPDAALASIALPHGTSDAQEQTLLDILSGALEELRCAGATLAGGHTLEGPRVTIGFTVMGHLSDAPFRKSAIRPGDALVLTKPIGAGVLLAAHMEADCRAAWVDALLESMLQSGSVAADLARQRGAKAATDVTGFGLAGHLLEMLEASGLGATLDLDALPLLPGAELLLAEGRESTMAQANRDLADASIAVENAVRGSARHLSLFDPQTSGGLLIAVPATAAGEFVDDLRNAGYICATEIATAGPCRDVAARLRCH